mgnify:FL=1
MKYLILLFVFALTACTTHVHDEGRNSYIQTIEKHSAGDKQFSGMYHNFEFKATILNTEVTQAIHSRMKKMYAWDEQESSKKLNEQLSELENHSKIWLSFFTGERKNDNLATKKSIWKIYLVAGSQRYEGHAMKANTNLSEAIEIYPYHTRWATPYYVEFPVPVATIEHEDLKLIITGPLGHREVHFSN